MKLESYSVMKKYVIRLSLKYFVNVISTILQAFLSTGVCIFLLLYLSSNLALCLIGGYCSPVVKAFSWRLNLSWKDLFFCSYNHGCCYS